MQHGFDILHPPPKGSPMPCAPRLPRSTMAASPLPPAPAPATAPPSSSSSATKARKRRLPPPTLAPPPPRDSSSTRADDDFANWPAIPPGRPLKAPPAFGFVRGPPRVINVKKYDCSNNDHSSSSSSSATTAPPRVAKNQYG